MMRSAIACSVGVSEPIVVMTANSSPPSRATRSSPRSSAGQAQRDVADQFVADRMAERVVDVLEVIEIDIEHGGRTAPPRGPP